MSKKRMAIVCGRMCEAPPGDYYVTCSFDPNHVILRSRMPYHIIKCVDNHPGHNKIQCPYDATEYIEKEDYENHILNCESRRSIYADKFESGKLKATGWMCDQQKVAFSPAEAKEASEEEWGGSQAIYDEDDFNEDLTELRPVGRGMSRRHEKPAPKKGLGRAETLKRILDIYNEKRSRSDKTSSNMDDAALRQNISVGQFEDA